MCQIVELHNCEVDCVIDKYAGMVSVCRLPSRWFSWFLGHVASTLNQSPGQCPTDSSHIPGTSQNLVHSCDISQYNRLYGRLVCLQIYWNIKYNDSGGIYFQMNRRSAIKCVPFNRRSAIKCVPFNRRSAIKCVPFKDVHYIYLVW